jgi:predicted nucleic acid-binding protein
MASDAGYRVFFDANVLFAAVYSPHGVPSRVLRASKSGIYTPVVSQEVVGELVRNIRRRVPDLLQRMAVVLAELPLEVIANPPDAQLEPWLSGGAVEDAHVMAAATLSGAPYLCTGDRRFIRRLAGQDIGIQIISPARLALMIHLESPSSRGDMP